MEQDNKKIDKSKILVSNEIEENLTEENITEKHEWSADEYSLLFLYFGSVIFLITAVYFEIIIVDNIPTLLLFLIPLIISLVAKFSYKNNKFFQILFKINCFLIYMIIIAIKCLLATIKAMVNHID